jgi:hypothetical protein
MLNVKRRTTRSTEPAAPMAVPQRVKRAACPTTAIQRA